MIGQGGFDISLLISGSRPPTCSAAYWLPSWSRALFNGHVTFHVLAITIVSHVTALLRAGWFIPTQWRWRPVFTSLVFWDALVLRDLPAAAPESYLSVLY